MSGKFLLDTNVVIALFAGEQTLLDFLSHADEIFIPSIVIGELNYGARKSSRVKENIARIEKLTSSNIILACDATTASIYGEIKDQLRLKGKPIPENDIWIAAIAIQHDLVLISREEHFIEVDQLKVTAW
jgi:tRNA(fMet)-specific endonuclease VapC